jgi:hypothetical protein
MFVSPPVLSAVPMGVVEYDFAPLFLGLVVGLCLCVLVLAVAIGIHDTQKSQPKTPTTTQRSTSAPELPNAA